MTLEEAKRFSLDVMRSADHAFVSTIDEEGLPQTRVMFNLRNEEQFASLRAVFAEHEDDLLIYLGTNTSSEKVDQIRANPAMCVCFSVADKFHSIMLAGRAEIVEEQEVKESLWQSNWTMYYPGGPTDPDYTVVRLAPRKGKGWAGSEAVSFKLGR